jgi:hypothetical protein
MQLDFFEFFRQVLIILITISLYWPLNVPFAALGYKIRNGAAPLPLEPFAFWVRSIFAGLGLAVLSVSLMGFDKAAAVAGMPPGPVHLVVFLGFVPLCSWWMYKIYALDDAWEGLSTLLLCVFVPGLILVLLKLVGVEPPHFINIQEWIVKVPEQTA